MNEKQSTGNRGSRNDIFESPLRYSSRILNSQLIRNSFYRSTTINPLSINTLDQYRGGRQRDQNRMTSRSPARRSESPENPILPSYNTFTNLKGTLDKLQSKIRKAQNILQSDKRALRHDRHHMFDDMQSISEIDSELTKKNEHTYGELTDHSTKLLSFTKNQSSISLQKRLRNTCFSGKAELPKKNEKNEYYVSNIRSSLQRKEDCRILEHLTASFEVIKNLHQIEAPEFAMIEDQRSNLPIARKDKGKKTLIIDIDETILHCDEEPCSDEEYDLMVKVKLSEGEALACIKLRPYAITFLKNMSKVFEIIVFTASHEAYIDPVLDEIDSDHQIFSHRLYRNHCHQIVEGVYTKDLRMINRKPENIVLLDNSPYSYIFQLENAIPILPFSGGPDSELIKLQKYLHRLSEGEDIREINKRTFKLHRYREFESQEEMIETLYLSQD